MIWILITFLLIVLELAYIKIARMCRIIDVPDACSSHSTVVLRGGGIIFVLSILVWAAWQGFAGNWYAVIDYWPFLYGLCLVAGVSFVDDIKSLPDSVRLVAQFAAMGLMFYALGIMHTALWWAVLIALVVYVGATNIVNFMDGINGMTGGYSLAVLVPLLVLNNTMPEPFILNSFLEVVILGVFVFCLFNFRPKGKAKCFAGDVGSISIAFILLFVIGSLIVRTNDITWLIFLLVYGVDGCLTICHRIMLHENLGVAHRKHVYQLMANELKIGHVKVTLIYMALQLIVSLGFIYLCPNTVVAHWIYLVSALILLTIVYILFKRKYYYLHEIYLASLKK